MIAVVIAVVLVLIGFYFHFTQWIEKRVLIAIALMLLYCVSYGYFSPEDRATQRLMPLFVMLPTASFAAILFPQFNQKLPEKITQAFGWFGLISLSMILLMFILFVW
ncbi:hypothetical protein [uncultured Shewanella sp.]|uniref:hypothetical protein n=1 Tax=uncultured Shewanella sp. TaxID=173975 RepID=UPI00262DCE98|nr:hypothetical protein [uncultured Shewanella sp.]